MSERSGKRGRAAARRHRYIWGGRSIPNTGPSDEAKWVMGKPDSGRGGKKVCADSVAAMGTCVHPVWWQQQWDSPECSSSTGVVSCPQSDAGQA